MSKEIEDETYDVIKDREDFEKYVFRQIGAHGKRVEMEWICEDLSKECDIILGSWAAFQAEETKVLHLPQAMVEVAPGDYVLVGKGMVIVATKQQLKDNGFVCASSFSPCINARQKR